MEGGAKMVARGGFAVKQQRDARAEKALADKAGAIEKQNKGGVIKTEDTLKGPNPQGGAEKNGGKAVPGD